LHELGIVIKIVKTVEEFARKNNVTMIETLVLQVGELSSVVPRYIESCYPMAVEGTLLEKTSLKIEVIPGEVRCKKCGESYNLIASNQRCPQCQGETWELISGREFQIKEIVAC